MREEIARHGLAGLDDGQNSGARMRHDAEAQVTRQERRRFRSVFTPWPAETATAAGQVWRPIGARALGGYLLTLIGV